MKTAIAILILAVAALGFVFYINVYEPLAFLDDPLVGDGLGNICDSEESCRNFCHTSRGRCDKYCQENTSNELCGILFGGRE